VTAARPPAGPPGMTWSREAKLQLTLAIGWTTVGSFATFAFASLSPEIRAEYDLAPWAVGLIGAMAYMGALVATVPAGRFTDRVGAAPMLALALAIIAGGVALAAGAPTAVLFFACVWLVGVGYGWANPPTNVLASATVPRASRASVMSAKQVGVTAGGALAGLILPGLAVLANWRAALVVPLLACVGIAVASLRLARSSHGAAPPGERHPDITTSGMFVYGFAMTGVQITTVSYIAVYLVDHEHVSLTAAGIGLAVTQVAGSVGRLGWGIVSDRLFASRLRPLQLASLAGVVGLVTLPWIGGALVYPVLALIGAGAIGWNGVFLTMVAESSSAEVGRATGSALFWLYAGAVACPPLFGLLLTGADSWPVVWSAMALAVVIAIAVLTVRQGRSGSIVIAMEESA
jgi:MFS family permease